MDTHAAPDIRPIETVSRPPSPRAVLLAGLASLRRRPALGAELPATRLLWPSARLDARAIAAYGRVCGFTPEQGVPATWPHVLAVGLHMALMMRRDFPYPLIGLVHLRNRIAQYARLSAEDAVSIEVAFGGLVSHARGQAFIVHSQMHRGDALVWEGWSTYLRRGVASPRGEPEQRQAPGPMPLRIAARPRLGGDLGRRYAAVSGDANPIHTSWIGARLYGFRGPIAHGMWSKAFALATLLPQRPIDSLEVDVAFRLPVPLPGSALLLSTRDGPRTLFELRDRSAARPHLRGLLTCTA